MPNDVIKVADSVGALASKETWAETEELAQSEASCSAYVGLRCPLCDRLSTVFCCGYGYSYSTAKEWRSVPTVDGKDRADNEKGST